MSRIDNLTSHKRNWYWFWGLCVAALVAGFLTGCTSVPFEPYKVNVTNPTQYQTDLKFCVDAAKNYPNSKLSFTSVGIAGLKGGTSNAAGAIASPVAPLLGAAGQASTELLNEVGVFNDKQDKTLIICMHKLTDKDGSALVLEPYL